MPKRRVAIITIVLLVAVAVLRETPFLVLSIYKADLRGKYLCGYYSERVFLNAKHHEKSEESRTEITTDFHEDNKAWEFAIKSVPEVRGSSDSGAVSPGQSPGTYTLTDVSLEITGTPWLPLAKSGKCEYHISFEGLTQSGATIEGAVNGDATLRTYGLCSARTFREYARTEILNHVHKDLRAQVSK